MRDEWYGDKRDVVKWGLLLHLAEQHDSEKIIQVAFFRGSKSGTLCIDGNQISVNPAVLDHFRELSRAVEIVSNAPIEVWKNPFENRQEYLVEVTGRLGNDEAQRRIVLLDPDTGLEPEKARSKKHVLDSELKQVWDALNSGDVMVLYQHAQRDKNWTVKKRQQFECALGIGQGSAGLASGPDVANDVVFFFSQKPS